MPLSKEGRAARRRKSPDYWKYSAFASSKAKPRAPLSCRSPCRVGVARVFLADSSSAWLPCALHRAGPSGCKSSVRLRLGGFRICLRQLCKRCLSLPQLLFHLAGSLLQFWLLQGGGLPCSRQHRVTQGEGACSTARVFSCSSSMAQLLLNPISKASCPPEEGPDPVDGLQRRTCGLPLPSTCTSRKDGVQMTYLVPEIIVGHHLACWLPPRWKSFYLGFPSLGGCFGCLCLKGHF